MKLHNDFSRVVVVYTPDMPWQASNPAGASLRLLEQDGDESSRSTSIMRYEAGTSFVLNSTESGTEVIVLDGSFSNSTNVFPAGSYIKNLSATYCTAHAESGCTLFVKQGHLQQDDVETVVIDVNKSQWHQGMVGGLSVMPLSECKGEHSALVRWQPGTVFNPHKHWGGEEIYVLEGVFEDEFGRYPAGTWMRNPHLSQHAPFSKEGCIIFVKVGHLPEVESKQSGLAT